RCSSSSTSTLPLSIILSPSPPSFSNNKILYQHIPLFSDYSVFHGFLQFLLCRRHPYLQSLRLCKAGDFVEKKSRLSKWLSKLFKTTGTHRDGGGSSSSSVGGSRRHPQLLGEENMLWRGPSSRSLDGDRPRAANKEKEELDRAIALSLAEDLRRPNAGRYGWRPTANNDEAALARAQQDNLNLSSYPPPYAIPPPPHYYPRGYRLCGGCHREIGYGNYLGCMGMFFHPECFRCHSCAYPITETEFSLSGKDPYHKLCFKELTHPKCEVCLQFVSKSLQLYSKIVMNRCIPITRVVERGSRFRRTQLV
ncbi:Protein DA1-related 2, partial [Linum grandiflorum]